MDNLTHGLLGAAIGATLPARSKATRKAAILAGVIAAELPDLDTLWPAPNEVIHSLQAHRGISHALIFTPVIAAVAVLIAKRFFKDASTRTVLTSAFLSVLFAHLLADLWTGWGTRLLLPFSDARLTLDWAMVVDPLITLPLIAAALWAWRKPHHLRRAAAAGLVIVALYLSARILIRAHAQNRLELAYPQATSIEVFPSWFSLTTWRYVAIHEEAYAPGSISLFREPHEYRVTHRAADLAPALLENPTVREAVAWARIPLISSKSSEIGTTVRIADLRYHLRGEPTLTFVLELDANAQITEAKLERGGSAKELLERWRK